MRLKRGKRFFASLSKNKEPGCNSLCYHTRSLNYLTKKKIYLQFALKMDFGATISERGFIIKSERYMGFSYRFNKQNASQYECTSCKTLEKN